MAFTTYRFVELQLSTNKSKHFYFSGRLFFALSRPWAGKNRWLDLQNNDAIESLSTDNVLDLFISFFISTKWNRRKKKKVWQWLNVVIVAGNLFECAQAIKRVNKPCDNDSQAQTLALWINWILVLRFLHSDDLMIVFFSQFGRVCENKKLKRCSLTYDILKLRFRCRQSMHAFFSKQNSRLFFSTSFFMINISISLSTHKKCSHRSICWCGFSNLPFVYMGEWMSAIVQQKPIAVMILMQFMKAIIRGKCKTYKGWRSSNKWETAELSVTTINLFGFAFFVAKFMHFIFILKVITVWCWHKRISEINIIP